MELELSPADTLPEDGTAGTLIGRAWRPGRPGGPAVVVLEGTQVIDISADAPSIAHVLEAESPLDFVRAAGRGDSLGTLAEVLANTPRQGRDEIRPWLLAPCDLQALKAAGVTFLDSLLERVI